MRLASIVMIALLRYETTKRCIESIFERTMAPFELIVVAVDCEKKMREFFEDLQRKKKNLKVIHIKSGLGTTGSRNVGIRACSGDYIVFMDNDALVSEGWLGKLERVAESSPDIGLVGPKILRKSGEIYYCSKYMNAKVEGGKVVEMGLSKTEVYSGDDPEVNRQEEVVWYPTTTLLVKREVIEKVGGFDEAFFLVDEDKDLCLSAREAGYKTIYAPYAEVVHLHDYRLVDRHNTYHKNFRLRMDLIEKDNKNFEKKWGLRLVDIW
ncbi:MAG: glycosyltransferase family 2 protein [Candidatus Hydrothermarchaeales archaeon]